MHSVTRSICSLLLLSAGLARPSHAQFTTWLDAFGPPSQTYSFGAFTEPRTGLPQSIGGGAAISLLRGAASIFNTQFDIGGSYPSVPGLNDPIFCSNGAWNADREGFVGLFPGATVRVSFAAPVRGVGAFMNYLPLCAGQSQSAPTMRVLDANMASLGLYHIDEIGRIVTPNAVNAGAFRGVVHVESDIFAVDFDGAFFLFDDLAVLGASVEPPSTTVPEPATMAMLAGGLLVLGAARRLIRRR